MVSGSATTTTTGEVIESAESSMATGSTGVAGSTGEPGPLQLSFEQVETSDDFTMVTDLRFIPGTDELLALSKDGRIGHHRLQEGSTQRLGGFEVPGIHSDLDCGLLSLAFDPQFERNRFIYVSACTSQHDNAIFRLTFNPSDYGSIGATRAEILVASEPGADRPWHNIGTIGFDRTGALWALLGDKRVVANGQDASNDLSALVRVIPNRTPGGSGHTPAPDNPFLDDPQRSANVYAWGLRSPWRGVYDHEGRWWIGDVGSDVFEEINLVTQPGQNFGWAAHEGPCEGDCADIVDPVGGWTHDPAATYVLDDEHARPTIRRAIWVGLAYDPAGGPDPYGGRLTGAVLAGDFCVGFVRALEIDDEGTVTRDEHLGHLAFPSGWDRGPDGYVYAATFGQCESFNIDDDDPPRSQLFRALPVQ
jgi:glucose/arabinose dehydrogenase